MDFEQVNEPDKEPAYEPLGPPKVPKVVKKSKKGGGWRIFWGIFTSLSVLTNIVLFLILIAMGVFLAAGSKDLFVENIVKEGPSSAQIAVIDIQGIIDNDQAGDICKQIKSAGKKNKVKGLIIRVNSPGGTVSASDRIYNEILQYRTSHGKPAVAFMQGLAASGGYYTSVGCNKIVAEPTTITGSIGVIFNYFVVQGLLEEKLGIEPVTIKSAPRKDWPSGFTPPTEEQKQYIQDKLITPAHERFVQIVANGREPLDITDAHRLADGSIYNATEALDEKLIDKIGYLGDAIDTILELAEIEDAQVIEYKKPFSFANILTSSSRSILKIDKSSLYELNAPELLYLWRAY